MDFIFFIFMIIILIINIIYYIAFFLRVNSIFIYLFIIINFMVLNKYIIKIIFSYP